MAKLKNNPHTDGACSGGECGVLLLCARHISSMDGSNLLSYQLTVLAHNRSVGHLQVFRHRCCHSILSPGKPVGGGGGQFPILITGLYSLPSLWHFGRLSRHMCLLVGTSSRCSIGFSDCQNGGRLIPPAIEFFDFMVGRTLVAPPASQRDSHRLSPTLSTSRGAV